MRRVLAAAAVIVWVCLSSGACAAVMGRIVGWGHELVGGDLPPACVMVAAGGVHSLALKPDGSIAAWGLNDIGQCNVPEPNSGFVAISAGEFDSFGLKFDCRIVAWGANDCGVDNVPPPPWYVAVAAGGSRALGIIPEGIPVIRDAKLAADGSQATIYGAIVSAAWEDAFYIEADDRTCGIRVEASGHDLTDDSMRADVGGTLGTNPDGERFIAAYSAQAAGSGRVESLGVTNALMFRDFGVCCPGGLTSRKSRNIRTELRCAPDPSPLRSCAPGTQLARSDCFAIRRLLRRVGAVLRSLARLGVLVFLAENNVLIAGERAGGFVLAGTADVRAHR